MYYLKLVKEGTIEDFIKSDKSKFPCVCCYDKSHPNYAIQQAPVITKVKPTSPILSFTIKDLSPSPSGQLPECTFQFEEGMTWEEWCNSKYNTLGWYIFILDNEDIYRTFVNHNYGDHVCLMGSTVRSTDDIIFDGLYTYNP